MDTAALLLALKDPDLGVRALAAQALGERGEPGDWSALAPLLDPAEHLAVRAGALRALGLFGTRCADPAAAAQAVAPSLESPEPLIRKHAVRTLSKLGASEAAEALLNMLDHPQLRREVIVALGRLKAEVAVAPLIALLEDEGAADDAIEALGEIGNSAAIDPIFAAAEGGFGGCREWYAVAALRDIGEVETLIRKTKEAPPIGRALAVRTLGELPKSPETIRAILAALREDAEPSVRRSASFRLSGWNMPLELHEEVKAALEAAKADSDEDVVHWVTKSLEEWDEKFRESQES